MGTNTKGDIEEPVKSKKSKRKQKEEIEAETPPSDSKKSKFNISVKVTESLQSSPASDLPPLNSGKGPKIIIAKDKNKDRSDSEAVKPRRRLNKRRKARLAAGLPLEEAQHDSKGQSKALQYLQTWAHHRHTWKFEKCRQIWLLHVSRSVGVGCVIDRIYSERLRED